MGLFRSFGFHGQTVLGRYRMLCMKKLSIFLWILGLILLTNPATTEAYGLDCYDVDGASIFGWDTWDDEYVFIGAISNEYGSESIANEYGAGNEYSSDSIMNDYGHYGSDYSSESAFNDYASKPPILLDDNLNFLGYLTTNEAKSPYMNTYMAIACAKESWASANSDHEDYRFNKIPGESYSGGGGYTQEQLQLLLEILNQQNGDNGCPANSHVNPNNSDKCLCNAGYVINSTKDRCVKEEPTYTCPTNSHQNPTDRARCLCNAGFVANASKNGCVREKVAPPISSIPEQKPETPPPIMEKDVIPECFANSRYDESLETCVCDEGFGLSLNKSFCIRIPENAHYVDSPTDVWLCNEGYVEKENDCIEEKEVIDENAPNMTEAVTEKTGQKSGLWKWLNSLFNKK